MLYICKTKSEIITLKIQVMKDLKTELLAKFEAMLELYCEEETKQQIDKFFKEVDTNEFIKSSEECFGKLEKTYKMKTIKNPKFENLKVVYDLGYGEVGIGFNILTYGENKNCALTFHKMPKQHEIGEDTTFQYEDNAEKTEVIVNIHSLESLEVLQSQLDKCREFLKNK